MLGHTEYISYSNSRNTLSYFQLNPSEKSLEFGRDFKISHYAGDVQYSVEGFIEKNRDTLYQDFKRLLYRSENDIISGMWPEGKKDVTEITKRPITAGTSFKTSIIALVENLLTKVCGIITQQVIW